LIGIIRRNKPLHGCNGFVRAILASGHKAASIRRDDAAIEPVRNATKVRCGMRPWRQP